MTATHAGPRPRPEAPLRRAGRRVLRSPLVDLLLGPHGVDRYLEVVAPAMTVVEARAEVIAVRRQTGRSATLTLRPNGAWAGFRPGQFVRAGFELDGVRRTRTYSPAGSSHDETLELTVTEHDRGAVSPRLQAITPGAIVHLDTAQGEFVLPDALPGRLVLISGGSGITPVLAMLRTLIDEERPVPVSFLHYARSRRDWLYEDTVRALAGQAAAPVAVEYRATRGAQPSPRMDAAGLRELVDDPSEATLAVCGPPPLLDAARDAWTEIGGAPERLLSETFRPPRLAVTGDAATGSVRFLRSGVQAPIGAGTLLEQAEAAGLRPAFGCRMGICKTCTCRKPAGAVRNLRTGEVSGEEDEDIQICVSVPAGDVALEL